MGPGKRIEALSMAGRFRRIQCEPIEHGKSPRVHPRSADPPSQDEFCRGVECVTGETRDYFESCGIRSAAPPGALVFKYSPGTECRAHIASCREPRHERHQSAGLRYDESHFNGHSSIGMFPRRRDFFPLRQSEYLLFGNTQCGLPILPELPELGGYIDSHRWRHPNQQRFELKRNSDDKDYMRYVWGGQEPWAAGLDSRL